MSTTSSASQQPDKSTHAQSSAAAFVDDPYPLFAELRGSGPVVAMPHGSETPSAWMVTRMEEAVQVLKNQRFTVDPSTITFNDATSSLPRGMGGILGHSMIAVDEPDHRRLRTLVSQAFTPKYIQSLRPMIQQIADELIDGVQTQHHMDLVNDFAFPLPINVISQMLGVPAEGQPLIREWSQLFSGGGVPRQDASRLSISQNFGEYLVQLIAAKRANPQQDLISQLVGIEDAGDRLDQHELLSMVALLIFAGHETTSNLIGNGMLTLFDHPSQLQRLQADLTLVPSAVEELLRYNGPVLSPAPRYAMEDVTLGGQQIHQGDLVLILLGSANRDASQFTEPDELEIARNLNRHVAFGQGIHVCLGAPLARLEGDIAFTSLLRRLPQLRLDAPRDSITWQGNLTLRGIRSLPVAF